MSKVQYKPSEVQEILKHLIASNDVLIKQGDKPISASLIGVHGIGKSTVCEEVAKEMGRDSFKLNLAQLTEPSELIGFYSKEYKVINGKEEFWVTENLIPEYTNKGFTYTGVTRTSPCPPDWVVGLKENTILILDDFSRGNQLFSQAVMELVNSQEMIGWDLSKKKIQIILNENPDDGNYNTSSLDAAQNDRMLKINMKWDAQDWASRAEKIGTDERLINFVLWKPELLENKKSDGIAASNNVSPRMMDKFFKLVSTIDNFEKNMELITLFGDISVGGQVTNDLVNFIQKNLDKLPSVDKLINEYDLTTAKAQLTTACGNCEDNPESWKSATAAILATRMYNYINHNSHNITKDRVKHFLELILHTSFSTDQKFIMVKKSMANKNHNGNQLTTILTADPRLVKYIVS